MQTRFHSRLFPLILHRHGRNSQKYSSQLNLTVQNYYKATVLKKDSYFTQEDTNQYHWTKCFPGKYGQFSAMYPVKSNYPFHSISDYLTLKSIVRKVNVREYTSNTSKTESETTEGDSVSDINQMAKRNRTIRRWLLSVGGMVFLIVIVGGLTRLTESGLSMVTWKPLGTLPPMNEEQWNEEFELYKQYPEYKKKNMGMTLSEFKSIYFYEYAHRMLGRLIGISFAVPAIYFWSKGYFSSAMKFRVCLIASLIGFQGFLGWYMVKSGLDENHRLMKTYNSVPRVSQYRLASHLGTAFVIYATIMWTFFENKYAICKTYSIPKSLKVTSPLLLGIIFVTALSGAFVAGMDAGLVYNEFPLMGGRIVPADLLSLKPKILNFFENATTVQFQHRVLATLTTLAVVAFYIRTRRIPTFHSLPANVKIALNTLLGIVFVQYALGITTLLTYVPVSIASLHQFGSLSLFTTALWLTHLIRRLK